MLRFTPVTTRLARMIDKAFRIMLSVMLVFQQTAWAMQDSGEPTSTGRHTSQRLMVVSAEEETELTDKLLSTEEQRKGTEGLVHENAVDPKQASSAYPNPSPSSTHLQEPDSASDGDKNDPECEKKLRQLELSWWSTLRWVNIDSLPQKIGYLLVLQKDNLAHEDKISCSQPVWLSGGSFPIVSESARKRVLFVDGFRQGAEFVIFRTLHVGITALALYQLYNYLTQTEPLICQGTPESKSVLGLLKFWENSDDQVLLGVFHDVLGKQNSALSYLKYLLAAPLVYGLVKGGWNTRQSNLSREEWVQIMNDIESMPPHRFQDTIRWLAPFHPLNRKLSSLIKNVRWNPHVEDTERQRAISCLHDLIQNHDGYTPINALGYAMQLVYGMNLRDTVTHPHQGKEREDTHLVDTLAHEEIDGQLYFKSQALALIQEASQWKSVSQKEGGTSKLSAGMTALYAHYLLWSLGTPVSWKEGVAVTLFKGAKLYVQAKLIQKIVDAVLTAEKCPQEPGVSMAGVEPWVSDLTQACFDANVQAFNIIPGQPTETLVGNLGQYYFSNCTVDLDFSDKGLDGETISNITRVVLDHNIKIRLLNLSGNLVGEAKDFEILCPMLTGIKILDLSNNYKIGNTEGSDGALGECLRACLESQGCGKSRGMS